MASDLFRKSNMSLEGKTNPYAAFGLTQNPFPTKPSVTAGAVDPRLNGSIYLEDLRSSEQHKFDLLFASVRKSGKPHDCVSNGLRNPTW